MAEAKTRENEGSVEEFLNRVADEKKRQAAFILLDLMKQVTGLEDSWNRHAQDNYQRARQLAEQALAAAR